MSIKHPPLKICLFAEVNKRTAMINGALFVTHPDLFFYIILGSSFICNRLSDAIFFVTVTNIDILFCDNLFLRKTFHHCKLKQCEAKIDS